MYPLKSVIPEYFTVYTTTGEKTYIVVETAGSRDHVDLLFLKGNFKDFNKVPLDVKEFILKPGDDLYLCGFAGGYEPPVCTTGEYKGSKKFMGTTDGYVAKGMSGGPVINRDGRAIGVNSGKEEEVSTFGILFGNIKTK